MALSPGQKLGKYEIRGELGKGAMGVVYLADDAVLERQVALKVMASTIVSDEELKQRFEREAKAVARLQHPNIVTVYDLGYDQEGSPFIAMELLKGTDLEELMRHKPPSFTEKIEIIQQVCRGLAHAHGKGIVHRDIKPANVFVTEANDVKIMDFGVARWMQSSQTQTGAILGTADYMSPEQIRGQKVDGRSDIFAVGVILYRLLTKKKPFKGENIQAVFFKILNADPPELLLPDGKQIPELQAVVDRALSKEVEERYANAEEMAEDLKDFLRQYHGALSGETVFETAFDPGLSVDHDSGQLRRSTMRPSQTHRRPATAGGTAVAPTALSPPPGRGGTVVQPARPTAVVTPTRVVRPAPRPVARPRRSPLLTLTAVAATLAIGAGGVYLYLENRARGTGGTAATEESTTVDLDSSFEFAEDLLEGGRFAQAFDAVQNILAKSPDNPRAVELQQRIRQALEKQAAEEKAPPTTTVQPTPARPSGPTNAQRAQALVADVGVALASGDLQQARQLVAQGEGLDPQNPRWRQFRQQITDMERALKQKSLDEERTKVISGYLRNAVAYLEAEDYDKAIEAYNSVLEQDPTHAGALSGKAQATSLKQQLELSQKAAAVASRNISESGTEYLLPPGQEEGPRGFEAGGGVQVKRATSAAKFPAEVIIELNPPNAQPGNPYVLRIRVYNEGNSPVNVKSLEIVSTFSGRTTGKGQKIPAKVQRINARATVLLHEVPGTWTEEQNQGSITVTVTLVGDARLQKTIQW